MAANIETSIWLAIKSRIDTLLPSYQRVYPGQVFTPPKSGTALLPYLRIGRITATPVRLFVGDGKPYQRTGFIIVTLVHPLGQNVSVYDQLAGQIAEHFNDETKMQFGDVCVSVPSYPQVVEGYEDNGHWTCPVRIPWKTFA